MTNVLKGSTRAPTEAVEVETAWEATTGLECECEYGVDGVLMLTLSTSSSLIKRVVKDLKHQDD